MAETGERPDTRKYGDATQAGVADSLQKLRQLGDVEYRVSDDKIGPGLQLVPDAAKLLLRIRGTGVRLNSDQKAGLSPQGVAPHVQTTVEIAQHIDQADGVHIEHGG